ncbi:MAG: glycosyltransferase, partial [Flavobacteriaceae bacterium]|nr:glycosyltransferase [Flavobacteriaceae bacterium]
IVHTEDEYIKKLNEINADNTFESKSVSDSVISRYGKNIIIEKYEKLFKNLVKGNPIK